MADLTGRLSSSALVTAVLSAGIFRGGYVWILWADRMPTQDSDMRDTPGPYIGICSTSESTPPASFTEYIWYKYRGDDGIDIYEFWLAHGNSGTMEEFLAAITDEPLVFVDTVAEYPAVGSPNKLYICKETNKTYRWDDALTQYRVIGSDYNEIDVIYGGISNGD